MGCVPMETEPFWQQVDVDAVGSDQCFGVVLMKGLMLAF